MNHLPPIAPPRRNEGTAPDVAAPDPAARGNGPAVSIVMPAYNVEQSWGKPSSRSGSRPSGTSSGWWSTTLRPTGRLRWSSITAGPTGASSCSPAQSRVVDGAQRGASALARRLHRDPGQRRCLDAVIARSAGRAPRAKTRCRHRDGEGVVPGGPVGWADRRTEPRHAAGPRPAPSARRRDRRLHRECFPPARVRSAGQMGAGLLARVYHARRTGLLRHLTPRLPSRSSPCRLRTSNHD